ncbi:MAG: hypothetical protein HOP00_00040 [Nitrospira sp.]|nr:hypothetical protein [Nitrospira sp.]
MRIFIQLTLLAVVGLVLGFGLVESALRVFHLTAPLQYEPNPWFGWGHTPNAVVWRSQDGESVEVKINSRGLRDFDYQHEKPEGTYRIMVLGDSFSEAVQVSLENSFPKLIEAVLSGKQTLQPFRIEVINAGVSGYGTDNELLFFRSEGSRYKPDLVLLEFCICNDVRNNWFELENVDAGGFRKPYFVPGSDGLVLKSFPFERETDASTPIKLWLNKHVRLYPFLREARDRLMSVSSGAPSGIPLDYQVYLKDYPESWNTAWFVTGGLLRELKREVAAQGAVLFVMIVPTRVQVYSKDWQQVLETYSDMKKHEWEIGKPNRLLHQILEQERIGYVDLLPPFLQHANQSGPPLYLSSDGHWNREGHRLASGILAEELIHYSMLSAVSVEENRKTYSEVQ